MGAAICIIAATVMLLLGWLGTMTVLTLVIPMMFYMIGAGIIYPSGFSGCISCFPEKSGATSSLTFTLQQGIAGLIATLGSRLHINDQFPLAGVLLALALMSLITIYFIHKKYVTADG